MTPIIKIELQDNYLVLPSISTIHPAPQASLNAIPGSPSTSMAMTSPVRTLSSGTASIASTLLSSAPSARSSFEEERPVSASPSPSIPGIETTALKGNLILTLSKPAKVSSLAISLNGSTHIAFLGTGKRSHYSRHHIRSQQFLIEPLPNAESYTLLSKDTISYPFSIEIPNHLPPSVTTPQGGTIYRLTAVLVLAKSNGIMSFLSSGSTFTTSVTVQIYRAPRNRCAILERIPVTSEDEEEEEEEEEEEQVAAGQEPGLTHTVQQEPVNENDMLSATVTHTWPGQLETKVAIPFTMLPPMSKADLHLRVRVLRANLTIKSFQAALWERAIFRVQKAGAPAKSKKHIIGVRERVVSAQRCDAGWVNESITSIVPHTFEKVVLFSIPNAIRNHNEFYTARSTNPSTFTSASKLKKRHLKEDKEIKDSEFGEIHVEIQHFIRYSIFVNGSVDSKGKTVPGSVERNVGDVPVIVHGLPAGPECDMTGLPSYLYSFSTSRVSYEEAQDYELEAAGALSGTDGETRYEGTPGPIYGDYENDDAFMAIMGYRGSRTPPSYEDSVGRPSVDMSISELQNVRPLSQNFGGGENSNTVRGMTR
ncbi:hypothetical protein BGZ51_001039 [Haplosporangium sp. Z 767]|nr:hypothetical protein BGZ51_001039 [Haplosporangium sp. Z 767]KAF9193108.1 hypothetical protein BGZ50_007794 [Haplosporangium sp. Z 11]